MLRSKTFTLQRFITKSEIGAQRLFSWSLCFAYCRVYVTCTAREHEDLKMRRAFQLSH